MSGGQGSVFDVLDMAPSNDLDQLFASVSVVENKLAIAEGVEFTNTLAREKAAPKKGPKTGVTIGAPNRETCEATPDPKSQVDVVFVVDTSDGMGEALAALSTQIRAFDREVQQYDKNPRYGLVAFVDRVEVRSLTSVAELERELDRLLSRAGMNRQPGGDDLNAEDAENGLDALHAATTEFTWRDDTDTLRLVVYASDASAAGRGTELSGAKVEHGYDAVVEALSDASIRVASFTSGPGKSGFSAKRGGRDSIPSQTAGTAFALGDLVSHRLPLRTALATLLTNPVCQRGLFE
ncbi:MAG: VWA domain-containing protein [Nannocystaceae bacterium]|nr:VWA domain-containing protein [Nannocystaceae bacterium]